MSKTASGTDSSVGNSTTSSPSIESGRFARAVTEDMTTERVADHFYKVHSQSGNTYEIDLQTGACTCPDCEQRGEKYVCKHTIRASLVEIITEGVTTRTVAKVAGYARDPDHGCPADGHSGECAGPLVANGELPCLTCCDATRIEDFDEYDVWMTVIAPDRNRDRTSVEGAASASASAEVGH